MPYLIASVVVAVLAGWLAAGLARRKGRSVTGWTIASVLFIVPVMILAVLPSLRGHERLPPNVGGRDA
jgi:uncharacterized membrane protein YeaQ/YmgE (transglycosylase-associated protein family)